MSTVAIPPLPPASDTFAFLCNLVRERSAIELEASKTYLVESRLNPVAQRNGLSNLTELAQALRGPSAASLIKQVVEAMTTNETSFFRDIHPFDALRATILPELITRRAKEKTLNIWSNACSSGQELYSVAMTVREHFPELLTWKVRLLGTDLSTQILGRAREGIFNQTEVNRGLPINLLLKYFQREGANWQIRDDLRKMTEFTQVNLVETWPASIGNLDIVFLRNVLIYFSPNTKRSILKKVRGVLRPDGYLFLGGAETTLGLDSDLERLQVGKATCYKAKEGV